MNTALVESQLKSAAFLKGWLSGRNYLKAVEAMEYASRIHTGLRKDGTGEFTHQVFIAQQLRVFESSLLYPEETIILAFLHDVLEDYPVKPESISEKFGEQVLADVLLMSKVQMHNTLLRKTPDEVYYRGMIDNPRVSVVKGLDRYHNISTMKGAFSSRKMSSYLDEAHDYTDPMLKEASALFPAQETVYRAVRLNISLLHETFNLFLNSQTQPEVQHNEL